VEKIGAKESIKIKIYYLKKISAFTKNFPFYRLPKLKKILLLGHDNTRPIKKISRSPGSVKGVSLTYLEN